MVNWSWLMNTNMITARSNMVIIFTLISTYHLNYVFTSVYIFSLIITLALIHVVVLVDFFGLDLDFSLFKTFFFIIIFSC